MYIMDTYLHIIYTKYYCGLWFFDETWCNQENKFCVLVELLYIRVAEYLPSYSAQAW